MNQELRIYNLCRQGTRVLGPGLRYVIWTQGCLLRCPGCTSPKSRSLEGGDLIPIQTIVDDIVSRSEITGITLSGGDPMLQAQALAELLRKVKSQRPELTVLCFTGYTLEKLTTPAHQMLLSQLDLLIDGPYVDEMNDGKGLRGSSNQRLHFLTDRLLPFRQELEEGSRQLEIHIQGEQTVAYGIPNQGTLNSLL